LVKRGVGELIIGITFGVLMVVGAYYVQVQIPIALTWPLVIPFDQFYEALFISIPESILIALVLYINEFPDYVADRDANKRTFVVRLGRKNASKGYTFLMILVYVGLGFMLVFDLIRLEAIIAMATIPLAVLGIITALRHYDESNKLGPANWATIMNQLLTGAFLTIAYILHGYAVAIEYTLILGVVLFVFVTLITRKLGRPPSD
jgi:1,4-dihydroxy-2-naphthoate octaprenyltransferase